MDNSIECDRLKPSTLDLDWLYSGLEIKDEKIIAVFHWNFVIMASISATLLCITILLNFRLYKSKHDIRFKDQVKKDAQKYKIGEKTFIPKTLECLQLEWHAEE